MLQIDLSGRVAVVTGGASGIGRAAARLLARCGAKVFVGDLRPLDENAAEFSDLGIVQHACDVRSEASIAQLIDRIVAEAGRLDILVNNAALSYFLPISEFATNRWMRAFAVNVHGSFMLSKAVLEDMTKDGRGGAVVNISSGAAIGPGRGPYDAAARGGTMYGATKAALERFTQGLAEEVAPQGNISITCVSPSKVVPTPGTVYHHLVDGMDDPRGEAPEYMARATLLLASERADKVNGRVTYSQQILGEFGWIENPVGRGIDSAGSGYSQV